MANVSAMKKADFLDMLQVGTVDAGNGTLFGVPDKRDVRKQGLTLVISTGGSGKSAIQEAIKTANQKMKPDYSTYVKFLVVDSATTELSYLSKMGIDTLNISAPGAQQRLNYSARSTFYKYFIPKDFPVGDVNSEGASQQRLIGKTKLYDQNGGSTNDQALRDKIEGYFRNEWSGMKNMEIDIMVLTGISGGNGSGTFLDIAAQAKRACPDPTKVNVYGYIMLPDTAEGFASSNAARDSLYRNGFSALKELESYMSIGMEADRKERMASTIPANDIELTKINTLFDYPVLISGNYSEAVSMIAETIVNSVADSGGIFEQKSFYSNLGVQKNVALSTLSENGILKHNAAPEDSHSYCGIGYAHASIPEKVVIPHVVGVINRKLYLPQAGEGLEAKADTSVFCTKERSLTKLDFMNAMRQLLGLPKNVEIKKDTYWRKFNAQLVGVSKVKDNQVSITVNEMIQGNFGQYLAGFRTEQAGNEAAEHMQKFIVDEYNNIVTRAQNVMKQYGPRSIEYLYSGSGNFDENGKKEDFTEFSLKTQLEFIKDQFVNVSGITIPKTTALEGVSLFDRMLLHKKEDEWKQAAKNNEELKVKKKVAGLMAGSTGVWKKNFLDLMDGFLSQTQRFSDILETMSDYYSGVGKSLDGDSYMEFSKYSGESNGINLCTDADMYAWVVDRINKKIAGVNIDLVREALVDDFYKNTDVWTSENPGDARTAYDEIMSRVCQVGKYAGQAGGMSLSIGDYFEKVLADVPDAQQQTEIQNAISIIFGNLVEKSAPSLKLLPGAPVFKNMTIMLPQSLGAGKYGAIIQNAFQSQLSNNASGGNSNVIFSSVVDSIVCYQTSVANALSDLKDLTMWEDAYESAYMDTTHLNDGEYPQLHMKTGYTQYKELTMLETDTEMHFGRREDEARSVNELYSTGLSWKHHPSINVARYNNAFDGTTSDQNGATLESRFRKDVFSRKVEEALRTGIIECEKSGNVYKYFVNLIPDDWDNLKVRGYKEKERKSGRYVRGARLFEYLANQNTHSTKPCRKQIALSGSPFFDKNGFDFTDIVNLEHWDPSVVDKTAKAYMMRILRKSTALYQEMEDTMWRYYAVEQELAKKEEGLLKLIAYKNFGNWFIGGVIVADEDQYTWEALTNAGGSSEELISFGRRDVARMEDYQKKMLKDGFRMKLVYDAFKENREELELTDELLDQVHKEIGDKLSGKKYDQMMDAKLEIMEAEVNLFKEKYGNSRDPLADIMDAYGVDDDMLEEIQGIVDFYSALGEVIEEMNSIF